MDEFGDWIYIILMVVVGISSLVGSARKKMKQMQTQMPSPEQSDPSYPAPSIPKKTEQKQPPPAPGHHKHQPFNAHFTFPVVETGEQTEICVGQEEETTLVNDLELDVPDSFRKALIYSEIINRKY